MKRIIASLDKGAHLSGDAIIDVSKRRQSLIGAVSDFVLICLLPFNIKVFKLSISLA